MFEDSNSLFLQIFKNHQLFLNKMEKMCKIYNINYMQLNILFISTNQKATVTTLANDLCTTRSAISQALVCLKMKGLVTKEFDEKNKKIFYVIPTKKAMEIINTMNEKFNKNYTYLKEILGNDDFLELKQLFKKLNVVLETKEEFRKG